MSENDDSQRKKRAEEEVSSDSAPELKIAHGDHDYELYGRQIENVGTEKINFAMVKCGEVKIQVLDVVTWLPSQ